MKLLFTKCNYVWILSMQIVMCVLGLTSQRVATVDAVVNCMDLEFKEVFHLLPTIAWDARNHWYLNHTSGCINTNSRMLYIFRSFFSTGTLFILLVAGLLIFFQYFFTTRLYFTSSHKLLQNKNHCGQFVWIIILQIKMSPPVWIYQLAIIYTEKNLP